MFTKITIFTRLSIGLCVLLAVLLAGCDKEESGEGRETAVFTPAAAVTFTPSPLSPTITPPPPLSTPVPTIFPLTIPSHPPENYQLTTWTENGAWELFQGFKNYRNAATASDQFWPPQLTALQQSMTDLGQEILLRSPDTAHQEDILWGMAWSEAAYGTDISIGYNPFRATRYYTLINLIEAGLNNHSFDIEHLDTALGRHSFQIVRAHLIPNLFGDEQPGYVFLISPYIPTRVYNEPGEDGILIVVQKTATEYKVIELDFTPHQFPDSFRDVSFEDLTGDGQPEIIIEKYFLMKGCGLFIQIQQWQGTAFVNIVDLFSNAHLSQSCDTPWGILPSENGQPPVIQTTEYNPLFAEDVIFQFQWNGEMLAARQVNYSALIPPTQKYVIEDIIEARYLSPNEKITVLHQVLSEWSSLNLEVAGKSYPDFIRFQIGMIQMQSGDAHAAFKTLHTLILSPTNPITPAISVAAQAYLTNYQESKDIYHACREALSSMSQLLPFETLSSPFSQFSEMQFLQTWGYVPDSSYNASVCNLEVFLPILLQSWNTDSLAELPDLLQQADVPIKASEYVDLDGDGINDWLMLIEIDEPTQTNNSYALWAFLAEGEQISAVFVQKIYGLDENITSLPITLFHSKAQPRPILFTHLDSKLAIFKVIHTKNGFIVRFVPYTQLSYSVSEYHIRPNEKGFELDVFFKEIETATFAWDIPSQRFVTLQLTAPYNLLLTDQQASISLFANQNPTQTISIILKSLSHVTEQAVYNNESVPRLYYLLALSYELTNDQTNAIATYWQLWQSFPASPYALIAKAKLQ